MRRKFYPTFLLILILLATGIAFDLIGRDIYWPGYASMIVFYGVIFFLGTWASTRNKGNSINDVMLAGRGIPLFVAVFTMSATWVGGGYINGSAEMAYGSGLIWAQAPWGYGLSLIIGGLFFAKKMRDYKFKTMLDPLAQRFGKRVSAFLFIPAMMGEIFWTAAILVALGTTFGTVLNLDFTTAIILSAIIAIAYTSIGGLWAVALTDVIQLFFIIVGLFIVVPFALNSIGGLTEVWEQYKGKMGHNASLFPPLGGWKEENWDSYQYYWEWWDYALLLIFGGIPWQVYFQRVLSAKTSSTAVRLSVFSGVFCIIAAIPAILIGIIGSTPGAFESVGATPPENSALILPYVVRYLTNPIVATVGLGAIAAAVMSSIDSSILSTASMASWNIYRPLFNPNATGENLGKVIKRVIWVVGISATLIALKVESVGTLWYLCSDLVYCILFPQLVLALFFKKANKIGSVSGIVTSLVLRLGGGGVFIPALLPYPSVSGGEGWQFPFRTFAMLSGLFVIIIVSLLTNKINPPVELKVQEDN